MVTTNVPPVTFGALGFQAPTDEAILAGVLADLQAAFGGNLNPALNTPQGQLASSMAAIISQADQDFLYYTTQTDPAFAQGRMQDAIGNIYFLTRNPAEPTVLQVSCSGLQGVIIPLNALIQDNAGNTYAATGSAVIPASGAVTVSFANLVPGPIAVPETGSLTIYQAIPGWDSASLVSGVIGVNTESQSAFESRRAASVAGNSLGSLPSIRGAVLKVPGVLDAYVTENTSSGTTTVGGVNLVPNSVYVAVSGGSASAIAQAIWSKKAPGCAYNGNTTVVVQDTNSGYSPPYPSYNVTFDIPSALPIFFTVNIKNSAGVPSNALVQIQTALQAAFAGGTFGSTTINKASIGATLYATQYVAAVTGLGPWASVISLQIGSPNTPAAVFTGSCGGSNASSAGLGVLSVSSMTSGTIGVGDWLVSGTAFSGTGAFLPGTQIVVQLSGTTGQTGTYSVSIVNQFPSQSGISAVLANQNFVSVNINQTPVLYPLGISLTLT
jgi:hypothetical protein